MSPDSNTSPVTDYSPFSIHVIKYFDKEIYRIVVIFIIKPNKTLWQKKLYTYFLVEKGSHGSVPCIVSLKVSQQSEKNNS